MLIEAHRQKSAQIIFAFGVGSSSRQNRRTPVCIEQFEAVKC